MVARASLDDIRLRIKELVAELKGDGLRPEEIGDHEALFDADWQASGGILMDSLEALELMVALANEYGIDLVADEDISELATVDEAARRVLTLQAGRTIGGCFMAGNVWTRVRTIGAGLAVVVAGLLATGRPAIVSSVDNVVQPEQEGRTRPASNETVAGDILPPGGTAGLPAEAEPQRTPPRTIDDIFEDIAKEVPGFGGVFFDPPGSPNLQVVLTDTRPEKLAAARNAILSRYPGAGRLLASGYAARQGQYDFVQLRGWYRQMRDVLSQPGVVSTGIDEVKNRLRVGIAFESDRDSVEEWLSRSGIPLEAINVEVTGPVRLENLDQKHTAVGGLQIARDLGGGLCTLGFNAYRNGVGGFVTASHCTAVQNAVDGSVFNQPLQPADRIGVESADPSTWTSQQDANCPGWAQCRYGDAAFARYDVGVSWTKGFIAKPQQGIQWNGATWFYLTGQFLPGPGATVQKVGRTTGLTQGGVNQTCEDVQPLGGASPFVLLCQDSATYSSEPGDSGAPVFQPVSAGSDQVDLAGIHWGRRDNGDRMFSQYAYFSAGIDLGPLDYVCSCGGGGR